MRNLSKSKLMAFRQCEKRLWLEIHRPDLRQDSEATKANFREGHRVGEIARQLYDPEGAGQLIDAQSEGYAGALARSIELLGSAKPIFEAGFAAKGALAFADVMLPADQSGRRAWRMIEVKSSTSVKDYHREDVAIQAFVARSAGVPLEAIALAHIDSSWTYPGGGDYRGLLREQDLTAEAFACGAEVQSWIEKAQGIARLPVEPEITTGGQCAVPFECGFLDHCRSQEPQAEFPVRWLPRIQSEALRTLIEGKGAADLRDVPDDLLNGQQRRVKACSLSDEVYFDAQGAAAELARHESPAYFLDFETIRFAVPIWQGARPYQTVPFQFSVHRLSADSVLEHRPYLDLSGDDPSKALAEALIAACDERGPVFVYSSFEATRIRELAERYPELKAPLLAIKDRIVDLYRIAQRCYYHPSQKGSWSIKDVLPAIAPDMRYDALPGVKDGGMAMEAYLEAISTATSRARRDQIADELRQYCALDTQAMVRLWEVFSGRRQPAS